MHVLEYIAQDISNDKQTSLSPKVASYPYGSERNWQRLSDQRQLLSWHLYDRYTCMTFFVAVQPVGSQLREFVPLHNLKSHTDGTAHSKPAAEKCRNAATS